MNCAELRTWVMQAAASVNSGQKACEIPANLKASLVANRVLSTDREYVNALIKLSSRLPQEIAYEIHSQAWSLTDIDSGSLPQNPEVQYVRLSDLSSLVPTKPYIHIQGQPFAIAKNEAAAKGSLTDQFTLIFRDNIRLSLSSALWKNSSTFFRTALEGNFKEAGEKSIELKDITAAQFFRLVDGVLDVSDFQSDYIVACFLDSPSLIKKVASQLLLDKVNTYRSPTTSCTIDLDLRNIKFPMTHQLQSLVGLPLRSLNLSGQKVDERALENVAKISSLEDLSLSEMIISAKSLSSLTALTHLRSLDISKCDQISGDNALNFLTSLPNLTTLNLSRCSKINAKALEALGTLHLKRLELRQMFGMGSAAVDTISLCSELERLDISGNRQLKDEHLTKLKRTLSLADIISNTSALAGATAQKRIS